MKYLFYWLPPVALMLLIFQFSMQQKLHVSDSFALQFLFFKTLHLIEYSILYVLVYRAVRNTFVGLKWQHFYNAFIITFFYALSDEIHQVFVPTREGTFRDVMIDTLAIAIAIFVVWKLVPKAPKKLKVWAKKLDLI